MGRLIGSGNTSNYGESLFISKAQEYLDDSHIIYWNRQIYGREFDVCILMPGKGVMVVELKGWREENILGIDNNDYIVIHTEDGPVKASPQKQARGYRFSLDRHFRQSINKFPLVFPMVCLPQVSKACFEQKRLDVVMEERFTILKEDLADNTAFFHKIDQALREVSHWRRDPFDHRTMLEVRNLFEADVDLSQSEDSQDAEQSSALLRPHDYSWFYYCAKDEDLSPSVIQELSEQYLSGCKLSCVVTSAFQMQRLAEAVDAALAGRGLVRNRDSIEISFDDFSSHSPDVKPDSPSFSAFNCSISVAANADPAMQSFLIKNGRCDDGQRAALTRLAGQSQFNAEQYFIEHAPPEKNIVIHAGAGTGKTYTMISRIGYICYTQNTSLKEVANRIVMITFTNEAADQMGEKLKKYFQNYYLITSNVEYLDMVSYIDNMQISTIHSFAKRLISKLGTDFGYGIDLGITSSEYYRRKKISDILDEYIDRKELEYGKSYTAGLGMPVYAIRDSILDFINKLHSKSIDIGAIGAESFGALADKSRHKALHELLAAVIPAVERAYAEELLKDNKVHLGTIMSILHRFVTKADSSSRLKELRGTSGAQQFMFVDEFQDTDDTQIEVLLSLAEHLDYNLFLVGDIKQCIYRFRGAKEKAFDLLHIEENRERWLEYSLQRNYRTDSTLLDIFDRSFSAWGSREDELLAYTPRDRLIGTRDYNRYLRTKKDKFFRPFYISGDELRIPTLIEEIKRIQKRIQYEEENRGDRLSPKEKSIAILVRENWQAELVKNECAKFGITVHTNTGGDLYRTQPALDMVTLVNALVHFDEAEYLYALAMSNFFKLDIPKSTLYELRMKIRNGGWRAQADEREQINYLIDKMNRMLVGTEGDSTWEKLVSSLRTQPVLQALRKIYSKLQPWYNHSADQSEQRHYQLNVDLLFEQLINACNVDRLTINTLQEHLYLCIVSQVSVDSRSVETDSGEIPIQCITVHKSKGLEYGHVIMPFCSASMDYIKNNQLYISTETVNGKIQIGYYLNAEAFGGSVKNEYYNEVLEKSEKSREEARILYVAMTRAIRSFSWIVHEGKRTFSWQNLIETEV